MTDRGDHGSQPNGRVSSVRIDRLVLRNVDLNGHDARALATWIGAAIDDGGTSGSGTRTTSHALKDIGGAVADRVRAELRRVRDSQ